MLVFLPYHSKLIGVSPEEHVARCLSTAGFRFLSQEKVAQFSKDALLYPVNVGSWHAPENTVCSLPILRDSQEVPLCIFLEM